MIFNTLPEKETLVTRIFYAITSVFIDFAITTVVLFIGVKIAEYATYSEKDDQNEKSFLKYNFM